MDYQNIAEIAEEERTSRESLGGRWLRLWSLYKTDPLKLNTEEGWQSRLNDGRVFEIVQTVKSYLSQALLYSETWVTLESNEPGLAEVLPLINADFRAKLNKSNFKRVFSTYLVQLLLTGFSGMRVSWHNGGLFFQVVNGMSTYIESSRHFDEYSYSFTDLSLNKAQFTEMVEAGLFLFSDPEEAWEDYATPVSVEEAEWRAVANTEMNQTTKQVRLCEFYCPEEGKLFRLINDEIVGEEEVDECPWILSTLFEIPESAYGLSLMDSSLGLVLEHNYITNRRLDNMALNVDSMWMYIDDGVIDPEKLKAKPGGIIEVGSIDSIKPLPPANNNFSITYEESALIDARIEKNTGTGALISSGAYRSGDRVTAQEINAVKEAGGNRLTDIYEHIEATFVIPLLYRCLELTKKHVKKSTVKVETGEMGVYDYYKLLPKDYQHSYSVCLSASQGVINRDRNVGRLQEFLLAVAQIEQFQPFIDYKNLYTDLLVKFGFDNPSRYLLQESPESPQESQEAPPIPSPDQMPQQSPLGAVQGSLGEIGGAPMQNALTELAAEGALPQMLSGQTQPIDPAEAAGMTELLNQPI